MENLENERERVVGAASPVKIEGFIPFLIDTLPSHSAIEPIDSNNIPYSSLGRPYWYTSSYIISVENAGSMHYNQWGAGTGLARMENLKQPVPQRVIRSEI